MKKLFVAGILAIIAITSACTPEQIQMYQEALERAEAKPSQVYKRTASEAQWARLRKCESSGNYQAISSTGRYRGAYQFSVATWRSVGGTGDPAYAPHHEQDHRAKLLYARSGRGQWPHCGRHLPA